MYSIARQFKVEANDLMRWNGVSAKTLTPGKTLIILDPAAAVARELALRDDCARMDPESVPLLETWLDRAHPDWRDAPPPHAEGPLDRAEALAVLGLAEGATEAEIRAAHRRLMRGAHPDQGGSAWLAARLNAARDLLLGT